MKKRLILLLAALAWAGAAHAQSDRSGSTLLGDTRSPSDANTNNGVVLNPNTPHATTSETTGNTRNTVGSTLIEQQDKTLSPPNVGQAPSR
jgi:hypothetical protein